MIRNGNASGVLAGAAALTLGIATPAMASHTVVTVGGNSSVGTVAVMGTNSSASVGFVTDIGFDIVCGDSVITGYLFRGAPVSVPNTAGEITNLSFSSCTAAAGLFNVSVSMAAGDISIRQHPTSAGDDVPITIEVPTATITGTGCNVTASGTVDAVMKMGTNGTAAPDGSIELTPVDFGTSTGFDLALVVPGAATSTCFGQVNEGDIAGPDDLTSSVFSLSTGGSGDISHG